MEWDRRVRLQPVVTTPAWGWREVLIGVGLMLPAMFAGTLLVFAGYWAVLGRAPLPLEFALPAQIAAYGLWLGGIWALFRLQNLSVWDELACHWPGAGSLSYLAAGPPIALATGFLAALLGAEDAGMEMIKEILRDPVARVQFVVFGVTIGPFVEELLFRGALLPVLVRSLPPAAALVITSLPFALMHGPMYGWSWQHLVLLLVVGAAFGLIRLRSGSTIASTLAHGAYNLTMFAGYFITNQQNHG